MLLAQITDFHLYADADQPMRAQGEVVCVPERTCARVLDHLVRHQPKPDALLLTGDLSDDGSTESYRRLDRRLKEIGIPYHWIPGNHDDPSRMAAELSGNSRHFSVGGWHICLLNSRAEGVGRADGELSASTLAELEQYLRNHAGPTLLAVHHPPLEIGSPWMDDDCPLRNGSVLRQLIAGFPQVQQVVFGHAHQWFREQRRGVTYLGTLSTSIQFVPRCDTPRFVGTPPEYRDGPLGYRLLECTGEGGVKTVEVRVERGGGSAI